MSRRKPTPRKSSLTRRLRGAASATERRLWEFLRRRQLLGFKFRRRSLVHGYVPDFWCPEARLAVEIDAAESAAKDERDAVRDTVLFSHGIHTVHVPSELIWKDSAGALELIQCALEEQTRRADA